MGILPEMKESHASHDTRTSSPDDYPAEGPASYRRYLVAFLMAFAFVTISIGLFNLLVDPYGVFGTNRIGIYINADRESKAGAIKRFSYDAVLMGNSKAGMIDTSQIRKPIFFSATFGGATIEELYAFADHHIHDAALAVLVLDFSMFAESNLRREDTFDPLGPGDYLTYLFSTSVLEGSWRSLRRHLQGRAPTFRPDGSYISDSWAEGKDQPNPAAVRQQFEREARHYNLYKLSPRRLQVLEDLSSVLSQRGSRVVILLPPLHEESFRILTESPAWPVFEEWRNHLQSTYSTLIDLTLSPYSAPENFFISDPVHFRSDVGARILSDEVIPAL